tara:strand:+ start:497 stop:796 length:300 start_codon:yes stop_codon:yes gene_type:complete
MAKIMSDCNVYSVTLYSRSLCLNPYSAVFGSVTEVTNYLKKKFESYERYKQFQFRKKVLHSIKTYENFSFVVVDENNEEHYVECFVFKKKMQIECRLHA